MEIGPLSHLSSQKCSLRPVLSALSFSHHLCHTPALCWVFLRCYTLVASLHPHHTPVSPESTLDTRSCLRNRYLTPSPPHGGKEWRPLSAGKAREGAGDSDSRQARIKSQMPTMHVKIELFLRDPSCGWTRPCSGSFTCSTRFFCPSPHHHLASLQGL